MTEKQKSPKKYYVIVERHYEYDDNYYSSTGGHHVHKIIYKSKKKAEEICKEKNFQLLIDDLDFFFDRYQYASPFNDEEVVMSKFQINTNLDTWEKYNEIKEILSKKNPSDLQFILDNLSNGWEIFEVQELTMED